MVVSQLQLHARRSIVLSCGIVLCTAAMAQPPITDPAAGSMPWRSEQAKQLIGWPGVKQDIKGALSLSRDSVTFVSGAGTTSIERGRILAVTSGFERKESGGTAGKVARAIIPFGGGSALAATATNKEVGLLTIEFRDDHNALHGAVFQMPKADAEQAHRLFGAPIASAATSRPALACRTTGSVQAGALDLQPLRTDGLVVPAEYRVLLYEQLFTRLSDEKAFSTVHRDGDNSGSEDCSEFRLQLTLAGFSKGNAALRASTGPLGLFVGATSLKVRVSLQSQDGKQLLDREIKVSQRGDTESLDVADKIAKSINKRLKKQLLVGRGHAPLD